MPELQPSKIVNLASAVIVLVGGMYILFFMPITLSLAARLITAFLLVVYFLWRVRYYHKRYNGKPEGLGHEKEDNTKELDKSGN